MEDSLSRTPQNHCAKFDATSFILAGEIHNRTNKINKQTVNDISTLCLSVCEDNNKQENIYIFITLSWLPLHTFCCSPIVNKQLLVA